MERIVQRYEHVVLDRWKRVIRREAGKVDLEGRLQMTRDDVEQDLTLTVMRFHRKWTVEHHAYPDDALVRHAIKWRMLKLKRASYTKLRVSLYHAVDEVHKIPDQPKPDLLEEEDRQETCRAVFYGLRKHLPKQDYALIYLRHGEGMQPREIGEIVGIDNGKISHRLYLATQAAREFLGTLGIHDWEDVLATRPEDLDL